MAHFISIIIPTFNRADRLSRALASMGEQTYPQRNCEILVVDNGAGDQTREVCRRYEAHIENFRYFHKHRPGLHRGRHTGFNHSRGRILTFADDDIIAFPTWLEGIAEAFENPDIMLAGGKCLPEFDGTPPGWLKALWETPRRGEKILPFLSLVDLGDSVKEISPYHVFGCNFSVRRRVLEEAGGFHPDAMPAELIRYRGDGETHVSRHVEKRGYRTLYHPKASVYHGVGKERMTGSYYRKRAYLQGVSDSYTQLRNGGFSTHWTGLMVKAVRRVPGFFFNRRNLGAFFAYISGYRFHRRQYRRDPGLRQWVTRKTYMESCERQSIH